MKTSTRFCFYTLALLFVLANAPRTSAQLKLPRPSQKSSVTQTVGLTDVTITYSRPGVKGRAIWGELVPYDKVWRTGANEATVFTVTDDVTINGQKLPAGTYSFHTIPSKDEWTIIFNKDDGQWGSFQYDEKKDALRVKAKPQTAEMQEWLSFSFPDPKMNSAQVALRWEKLMVPFTVEVDTMTKALADARAAVAAAKPDDWRTPFQAASWFVQAETNMDEARKWVEQSIAVKETYNNLSLKSQMLAKEGKTGEAIPLAEKAIQLGKAAQPAANTSGLEKMLAEWKAKKM